MDSIDGWMDQAGPAFNGLGLLVGNWEQRESHPSRRPAVCAAGALGQQFVLP